MSTLFANAVSPISFANVRENGNAYSKMFS